MTTKNHLVFDLLNSARGGKQSDDENISLRQVGFWVDNTRALLIRRDLEKNRSINPDMIQTLGCVDVAPIDASECPCNPSGCTVLRTVQKIPNAIELHSKNLITRVGPALVGSIPFSLIPYSRAQFAGSNRYTRKFIKAFIHNGYVYLIGDNPTLITLEKIAIDGVFENPEELGEFSTCSGQPCYSDDDEYPISAWMIEPLKEMINKNNFRIAITAPTDTAGNATHDVSNNQVQ